MWGNDHALEQWFAEVKIRRSSADNPATERIPEEPPQGFTRNALVDELMGDKRRGR